MALQNHLKFFLSIFLISCIFLCNCDQSTSSTRTISKATSSLNLNKNFIHHHHNHHNSNLNIRHKSHTELDLNDLNSGQQIFINQSNNIYILAKYGQTVSLPCVVYRQKNQDLSNVHTIWHKLADRQRPVVLSIGLQQLKQDMRYRVKIVNLNRMRAQSNSQSSEPLVYNDENEIKISKFDESDHKHRILINEDNVISDDHSSTSSFSLPNRNRYLIQNWQFEIRKLTYDDAGTYQCLLPLVKPLTKNITLQVIPDLVIEPREGNYKIDEKIVIKCKATLKYHQKNSHQLNQRHQKPNIHWYKENEIIKSTNSRSTINDQKIEIDTRQDIDENLLNSVLTIHNAKVDDSGKYRCIYDNIQEQVNVKVIYDYYEYKNYLSSSTNKCKLTILELKLISLFVFLISISISKLINC